MYHELKNDIITRDEPELFANFVTLLQKLDQKRCCLTALALGHKAVSTTQTALATHIHTPHMHLHLHTHPPIAAMTPMTTTIASGVHAGPMDLLVERKKLIPEERACHLTEGHCLYYGGIVQTPITIHSMPPRVHSYHTTMIPPPPLPQKSPPI